MNPAAMLLPSMTALLLLLLPCGVRAGPPAGPFAFPLACSINRDCFVQNLFDHDTGPGTVDHHCGSLTYDGHTGTDIRLPALSDMSRGVTVLAAADGRVRGVRDGMEDISVRVLGKEAILQREAGNSVLIDHGNGLLTLYAHMRKGSVAVTPGEQVTKGQKLGLIGLSGNTEFPHLHFEVRRGGKSIDPFTGVDDSGCTTGTAGSLWDEDTRPTLAYVPTGVLGGGFTGHAPSQEEVLRGVDEIAAAPKANAPALVFWVNLFGMRAGDEETLTLYAPDGSVVATQTRSLDRDKAQWLSFLGLKRRGEGWQEGIYRGTYRLTRKTGGVRQEILNWAATMPIR